jgi:undecaprenyl diphosphate synthase
LHIKYLTLYTFSTENWNRPKKEIEYLFFLFKFFYQKNFNKINKNNIRIKFIGDLKNIPADLKVIIKKIQEKTKKNNLITVVFAFNYGAKSELINAFKKIHKNKKNIISEELISNNLYTKNMPNPDILVRTGGEKRLSNFLLWQLSYAELFFIEKSWPDFNFLDLKKIVNKFIGIKRRFGGLDE